MNKSESVKELATALAKCQGEMKNPPKSADNPFFKSKYATLDTIVDTIRPVMAKYGLSFIQSCSSAEQNITVTTLLMHSSGEWIESDPMTVKATKLDPQGAGSAITYARRYTLAAMLGVASEEDDDGNNASEPDKANKKKAEKSTAEPVGKEQQRTQIASQGRVFKDGVSDNQLKAMHAMAGKIKFDLSDYVAKKYEAVSTKDLTKQQASEIISHLNSLIS